MELSETLKEIKRGFRLYMNGTASHSMREKGLNYKVNWGISQVELRKIAEKYNKNADLAAALWKENVRECKILATLLMPVDSMSMDKAVEWGSEISSYELAETTVFNLFRHLPFAAKLVDELLLKDAYQRVAAYHLLLWLLKGGKIGISEVPQSFWGIAANDIRLSDVSLRKALINNLLYMQSVDDGYSEEIDRILSIGGIGAF